MSGERCSRQESDARGSRETSAVRGVGITPTDPHEHSVRPRRAGASLVSLMAASPAPGKMPGTQRTHLLKERRDGHNTCRTSTRCRGQLEACFRKAGASWGRDAGFESSGTWWSEGLEQCLPHGRRQEEEVSALHSNPSRAGKDVSEDLLPSPSNISSKEFSAE